MEKAPEKLPESFAVVEPITRAEDIAAMAKEIEHEDLISFDTEFIRENTFYPSVELIQIGTRKKSWLIDAQAFRGKAAGGLKPLLDIFQNPKILKILHAAQGDQECLFTSYGVVAKPSFDTAVGAALCGLGDGIGLGNLLKALMGVNLKKGHARTNWAARPLPKQLLEYAHADVTYLVAAADKLIAQLAKAGRKEWALELSAKWEDEKLYQPDPEGMVAKLAKNGRIDAKSYVTLIELMKWREERVRQLNLPRRWVADDQVLLDLSHVRPKDMEHLSAFRGLNKGEMKASGEKILEAIRRAADRKDVEIPKSSRPDHATSEEAQVLDLLKTYVGILADREKIALKHLMTVAQLLPILRGKFTTPDELVAKGILSAEAARLVGGEILALLNGKRAISVVGAKIKIVEI